MMDIDEALKVLESFCKLGYAQWEVYKELHDDILATDTIVKEYKYLRKRLVELEIESVKRENKLAKLECHVEALVAWACVNTKNESEVKE